jgi:hypothetical protein
MVEWRYESTILILALDGGDGQFDAPAALPRKRQSPTSIVQEADWDPESA